MRAPPQLPAKSLGGDQSAPLQSFFRIGGFFLPDETTGDLHVLPLRANLVPSTAGRTRETLGFSFPIGWPGRGFAPPIDIGFYIPIL